MAQQRPDPLLNPLQAVLTRFTCTACGKFDTQGSGSREEFSCHGCLEGSHTEKYVRCAYTSLIYSGKAQYVVGALALVSSLQASGASHDLVLLHTTDVPVEAQLLLAQVWSLKQVAYIKSQKDLHVASEKAQ